MISELLNTACKIDRDYHISSHVKNMIVMCKDLQPIIIIGCGYYQYVKIFTRLLF
jgi:hypothetical protein